MDHSRHYVHPLTIVSNLYRVLYLTVIPVLRGFASALRGGMEAWLRGAWLDILVLLVMVAIAVLRWRRMTYRCTDSAISINAGLLFTRKTTIDWRQVVTITIVKSFYLRPFGAVRLRADTLGGSFNRADFSLLLRDDRAQSIFAHSRLAAKSAPEFSYTPTMKSIFLTAVLTSSSFAGIVYLATFISQSGKVIGGEFMQRLVDTFEFAARNYALGIPPAAAAIAYALLLGWLLGFCLTIVRYKNFMLRRKDGILEVTSGIFTQRLYKIKHPRISFLDIRQSLSTRLLRLCSAYVSVVGFGKHKDDISSIILTESKADFDSIMKRVFPQLRPSRRMYKPLGSSVFRFLSMPAMLFLSVPVAGAVLVYFFPAWREFVRFACVMLMIPALLFFVVQLVDFITGGASIDEKNITLRYSTGFILHTVVIPHGRVAMLALSHGMFQQISGKSCDLIVHTKTEGYSSHTCRSLSLREATRLLDAFRAFHDDAEKNGITTP